MLVRERSCAARMWRSVAARTIWPERGEMMFSMRGDGAISSGVEGMRSSTGVAER